MHNNLISFLKSKNIKIDLNEDRITKLVDLDIELKTTILLIVVDVFGKSSNNSSRKIINRNYLKLLLYLALNPLELENVCRLKSASSGTFFEHLTGLETFYKTWSYFEKVFTFLKVQGVFKEVSKTQIELCDKGVTALEILNTKIKDQSLFVDQFNALIEFKNMKLKLSDLGVK
ncbi:MAG: hypothetical protein A2504_09990 [Bdellovibrionales bacterium RIFOXYD12_FULL_39_22]|nr:MAG: hypothetical protein A2385_17625 [Bdellovibrionales bacterium RIFOXYB1_FULL_39_21]OFZ43941.1 MAG: hypothetical protein A2485_04295 [Bdellovibrionales bacterium RIFOXYC12_FULL_39_17]OFZ48313.1 MAG: hypothetical protein A2404_01710 [Bdellovibrionales bacterium RIFOXYC1_FULL_39_130]OFZ94904.1 MAG: hypothetical protein A2504_09990 [Bdellovibrionales bacterium RIFOXYD12_FULL_39_22]HLE12675.1 hypothetical protein [Bacteriovoracaceae bacterium]